MISADNKLEKERNFLNCIKVIHEQTTANLILNDERFFSPKIDLSKLNKLSPSKVKCLRVLGLNLVLFQSLEKTLVPHKR